MITHTIRGEELWLLPERAVYWQAKQTLLVADLHLGKTATFRQHGIPLSDDVLADDLERLERILLQTGAKHLIILGDLLHESRSLSAHTALQINRWFRQMGHLRISVVPGNHDRGLAGFTEAWGIEILGDPREEGPFALTHQPEARPGFYTLSGHVHPVHILKEGKSSLRLPCFYFGRNFAILPAFGGFTGGYPVRREAEDAIFVIADDAVIAI